MQSPLRRTTLPFLALTLALALAACASESSSETEPSETSEASDSVSEMDPSSEETETTSEGAAAESSEGGDVALNEADVTFLQGMVPHHMQATMMAEMVEAGTDRPELAELAATIRSTQTAEIDQMNGLLEAAGEDPGMGGMDMGSMDMPGMMDEAQMAELMQLRAAEFDLAFLDMMTEHHSGAIEMAEMVLADGENPEVVSLAQDIIDAQQAEIDQMAEWRTAWS